MIVKDDKYEPGPAAQNTNDLITKDKVFLLFGYVGTPTLTRELPLLKYYQESEIVDVAPFTGADSQRNPPYYQCAFNVRVSYRERTRALADYLYERGFRRIGLLGQADAYGKSGLVQQRIVEQVDLPDRQVVGSAPVGVYPSRFLSGKRGVHHSRQGFLCGLCALGVLA